MEAAAFRMMAGESGMVSSGSGMVFIVTYYLFV